MATSTAKNHLRGDNVFFENRKLILVIPLFLRDWGWRDCSTFYNTVRTSQYVSRESVQLHTRIHGQLQSATGENQVLFRLVQVQPQSFSLVAQS